MKFVKDMLYFTTFCLTMSCQTAPEKRVEVLFPEGPDVSILDRYINTQAHLSSLKVIPDTMNPSVQKWLDYFQGRGRKYMNLYLSRSSKYQDLIASLLKEADMPEDLIYIVFIESGFSGTARSRASAIGYWQFIKGTGLQYGLKINHYVDERRDPELSTIAAIKYFKSLYSLFGSWYLSFAAYNAGENKIKRIIMRNQTRDFWQLAYKHKLPVETTNYVPKFLAVRLIAKNPKKYGFTNITYEPQLEYTKIPIEKPVDLHLMAKHSGISRSTLRNLNPSVLGHYLPVFSDKQQYLKLPIQKEEAILRVALSKSYVSYKKLQIDSIRYHRVRRGETVSHIARRFGTTIHSIRNVNGLGRRYHIKAGQVLKIPYRLSQRSVSRTISSKKTKRKKNKTNVIHVVKKGDTLFDISRKYKVSMRRLAYVNSLKNRSLIYPGRRLVIPD